MRHTIAQHTGLPAAVAAVIGLALLSGCDRDPAPPARPAPGTNPGTEADGATPLLEDVTAMAGIDFQHDKHETGNFRVPEINGAGVGVLDYDNDGWYDLYFVQGGKMSGVDGGRVLSDQLYRNRGDGTFENVTEKAGIHATGFGMGVACGDVNNDGFTDIFVYNVGPNMLLLNNGDPDAPGFIDVSEAWGVNDPRWGDGAAFLDYDADGWLDLFVCNYFIYDPDEEKECTIRDIAQRDYCGPAVYHGDRDILYRNTGATGRPGFSDVSRAAGIDAPGGTGMGVGVADFDGDGLQDIYVGNDARPNRLYIQQPDHTFIDQANARLVDVNEEGMEQSSMGITIEDFNLDGRFDLLLGHFWDDNCTLYLNQGPHFRDVSRTTALHGATRKYTTWAISVLDLHNDGDMDIYFGNGKVNKANKVIVNTNDAYAERDLLLSWSYRNHSFTPICDHPGVRSVFGVAHTTRGSAVIDYDNDGDMDLVLAHNNGPARLLRNNAPPENHWLLVRCIGPDGRRDHIGAVIEIEAGDMRRRRQLFTSCSYCSSSDPRVHFGLGDNEQVDRLTVTWVDGRQSVWQNVPADQVFTARYDAGSLVKEEP